MVTGLGELTLTLLKDPLDFCLSSVKGKYGLIGKANLSFSKMADAGSLNQGNLLSLPFLGHNWKLFVNTGYVHNICNFRGFSNIRPSVIESIVSV